MSLHFRHSSVSSRSLRFIAVALVAALAALAGAVAKADAYVASEIGDYRTASVTCDSFANTIEVMGRFGAGTYYNGQWLRVRYWALDVEKNQTFWLSPNGAWTSFYHQRWDGYSITPLAPNVPSEKYTITGFDDSSLRGYHRFQVYAQYQWLTTSGWVGTLGIKTGSYGSGYGSTPDCYL
jgi:hypothetical protein